MSEKEKFSTIGSLSIKNTFIMENIIINKSDNQLEKWKVVHSHRMKR